MMIYDYSGSQWVKLRGDSDGYTQAIVDSGYITPIIGSGSTQKVASGNADNGTTVLYTVTAATTLYLISWTLTAINSGGAISFGVLFVTNAADATQYTIARIPLLDNRTDLLSGCCPIPLEIQAGWKVKILSNLANFDVYGWIHGYEV